MECIPEVICLSLYFLSLVSLCDSDCTFKNILKSEVILRLDKCVCVCDKKWDYKETEEEQ